MTWPRWLRWAPHVLVVLGACTLAATGAELLARILAIAHAAALVVALRRPLAAFWLSMAFVAGIVTLHPPTHDNQVWVWSVHAGVLLLVALRNALPSTVVAAVLSGLLAVVLKLAGRGIGDWGIVGFAAVLFAAAVLVGATVRGRRETRARLTEQIAATAHERALGTVLKERTRIARELHDVVAHHMSVISIQADAAPYRVENPPRELVAEFAAIRANAREGLTELRSLLGVLRSEESGAGAAPQVPQPTLDRLDDLLDTVRAAGLRVTADLAGTRRPLPPGVELSAYRIVQEALSNALRHSPGAPADVRISYTGAALGLRVLSGAPTRTPESSPGAGHGVLGMRERAAMFGGELTAGPTPDGGYEVTALLPVPPDRRPGPTAVRDCTRNPT
ncbi:sensor histidine kinase [Streptomyces fildesensis]|uniref:histidine kinase n=1 Tax=Streptomyces fildesensis TaxID=375757 RepID=A0ABW8CA11_9ACTN